MLRRIQLERESFQVGDNVFEGAEAVGIGVHVQLQLGDGLGRDPPGAQLGAGKLLTVENRHPATRFHELARTRGSRRPATDDQGIVVVHLSRATDSRSDCLYRTRAHGSWGYDCHPDGRIPPETAG